MKIKHRFTLNINFEKQDLLRRLGIEVGLGFQSFELFEDHDSWPSAMKLAVLWDAVDVVSTEFTAAEIRSSTWLFPRPSWQLGYPQPADDAGYKAGTFAGSIECLQCGVGLAQSGPFRMIGEPKWGRRQIGQLHWIPGEWFMRPETFHAHFEPAGLKAQEVLHASTMLPLVTVVQLVVEDRAAIAETACKNCPTCGIPKRPPHVRGPFPPLAKALPNDCRVVRLHSWFGSGALAYQPILFHRDLYLALLAAKVQGARFVPVSEH